MLGRVDFHKKMKKFRGIKWICPDACFQSCELFIFKWTSTTIFSFYCVSFFKCILQYLFGCKCPRKRSLLSICCPALIEELAGLLILWDFLWQFVYHPGLVIGTNYLSRTKLPKGGQSSLGLTKTTPNFNIRRILNLPIEMISNKQWRFLWMM